MSPERCGVLEHFVNAPHERILGGGDTEGQATILCASQFDVEGKMSRDESDFLLVLT